MNRTGVAHISRGWTLGCATSLLVAGLLVVAVPRDARAIEPNLAVGPRAQLAVQGTVVGQRSAWDGAHRLIYTYTKVRVSREIKGQAPAYVTIRQPGGKVRGLTLTVSDQKPMAEGERVGLYLKKVKGAAYGIVAGPGAMKHLGGPQEAPAAADGYLWDGTKLNLADLPMPYYVNTSFNSTERSVLQAAFATWQNDSGSAMTYSYAGTTNGGAPAYDGNNVMTKGSTGGSIATTYFWSTSGRMLEADIVYDYNAWPWSTTGAADKFDLQNIATHESGHTLVLGDLYDAANTEQTMYGYADYGETNKRTLNSGDMAGIRVIYPDTSGGGGRISNVAGFTTTAGNGRVALRWRNPTAANFAGVLIVRKVGSAPVGRTDGEEICNTGGTSWTDQPLTNGTTYYYGAYAYDLDDRYAAGVVVSARPRPASSLSLAPAATTITWGGNVLLYSVITPAHGSISAITLRRGPNGSQWTNTVAMPWNVAGSRYEYRAAPGAKAYYRANWGGDWGHLPAVSRTAIVYVRPKLAVSRSAVSLRYGSPVRVKGYVQPRHDGALASVYYEKYVSGAWRRWATRYPRLAYYSTTCSRAVSTCTLTRGTWRARFSFGDTDHSRTGVLSGTITVR